VTESKTIQVSSRKVQLDETRHVSVGYSEDEPGTTFIEFVNADGVATRLKLSAEAVDALRYLLDYRDGAVPSWRAA
jgi:hypothetical protein